MQGAQLVAQRLSKTMWPRSLLRSAELVPSLMVNWGAGVAMLRGWLPRSQPVASAARRIRVEEILRTICSSSYNTKS